MFKAKRLLFLTLLLVIFSIPVYASDLITPAIDWIGKPVSVLYKYAESCKGQSILKESFIYQPVTKNWGPGMKLLQANGFETQSTDKNYVLINQSGIVSHEYFLVRNKTILAHIQKMQSHNINWGEPKFQDVAPAQYLIPEPEIVQAEGVNSACKTAIIHSNGKKVLVILSYFPTETIYDRQVIDIITY